ncbi:hypothetical protein PHJA_001567200 [Phtheirospermum japonicum]|uniref:Uncharacterized protein n=1 Tax=Phtheirospermum japonicum TaxID=374723 RepID=A0A830C100_9LAMI|nr:hypothetical protein PHJA_001567200 [Phtheirospermum japonicum]
MLSTYIFSLCSEAFSCVLQDLKRCGKISGVKVARNAPIISHLDTQLVGCTTVGEATHLRHVIQLYELSLGQKMNLFQPEHPSYITATICEVLGIPLVDGHKKYLDLPSIVDRIKCELFISIEE